MYDWANSAFATTMLAAVMPIYYKSVAGQGLEGNMAENYWGYTQSAGMLLVAVLSPVLGAIADASGSKVKFLAVFAFMGALASSGMALAGEGDWLLASILVILGTLGFSGGNTFYDGLLTDIAGPEERSAISSRGYAIGYLGGGVLLAVNVAMIMGHDMFGFPDETTGMRAAFLTVGIWWLLFSIPLFRHVKERSRPHVQGGIGVHIRAGFGRIAHTFKTARRYPELLKYMIAYWFFNDGINTIITMATIYGAGIGIGTSHLIIALLITQFVGYPSTLLFIPLARRMGDKRALYLSLSIYLVIVVLGYFMTSALHFYILAFMVGLVQGGSQAISRSLYANLTPPSRSAEFFGFLSLSSKFSSVAGPLIFAVVGTLTGSSRIAIVSVAAFFIIGMVLLRFVDLEKGAREALAGEA
ncbi:UMF1 family MFS transporter [Paenibacillus methanolicus]|uniref:UMF1 family MFS transporter n=2 Tax=Paenibacillus methanolicus TaxID=582686 RepID=A0A5S5BYK5_9BACL|nr:UMF1 family MFS transporter [Paenibacillus methanolicus]